jgi:phenylalanyl-tRNA synthetase beta chain
VKISLNWVADYVDLPADLSFHDLAHDLTLKTVEVEDWEDTAAALEHIVVGKIRAVEPLSDKGYLKVTCEVGPRKKDTVVSRLAGLSAGAVVAVARPGARLRAQDGTGTRVVGSVDVLGVSSNGVICSPADLGLQKLFPAQPARGPLDLSELEAAPGTPLAAALGYDDVVLEIDNKSLTNRPDLWGHYGIARELSAIYDLELKPLSQAALPEKRTGLVGTLDPELCQRFTAVEFRADNRDRAPLWLRSRLARVGEGSVNLLVDMSNYVMFAVGQPTHVYDADRISLPLGVARNQAVTKLDLVTGEGRELDPSTPVVRDMSGPVAVAGIMGGVASAVTNTSSHFVLEAATFTAQPTRKSSQRLSLRTEASARYEKGLDTQRVDQAVDLFLNLLEQLVPGRTLLAVENVEPAATKPSSVDVSLGFLDTRIGKRFGLSAVSHTLQALGFTVEADDGDLHITGPTWRSTGDIGLPEDIVEEVARIYGYDNIPVARLSVPLTPVRQLNLRPLDRTVREQLATRAGMQEVVTYPWTVDDLLAATGYDKSGTILFEGAPAPDRNSLRPALIPNLLDAVVTNLRYHQSFRIFEVGTVFRAGPYQPFHERFEALPDQRRMLAGALVGSDGAQLFRLGKGILEMLRRTCHIADLEFAPGCDAPWADQTVRLGVTASGVSIGGLALVATRVRRAVGIENVQVLCFEVELGLLTPLTSRDNRYEAVSELPEAEFDLSIVVPDSVPWSAISTVPTADVNRLINRVTFVDEYRGSWVPEGHRSVTLRVALRPMESTLTADNIALARRDAINALEQRLSARLRE